MLKKEIPAGISSYCDLNLIVFNAQNAAFVVTITGDTRAADDPETIRFQLRC